MFIDYKWNIKKEKYEVPAEAEEYYKEEYKKQIQKFEVEYSKKNINDGLKYITVFLAFLIIVIVGTLELPSQSNTELTGNTITIIADYLYIMKSTDIYSNEIGKVYKDEVFNIMSIEKTDERTWYEIETKQGIRGYIRDDESFWGDRTKQTIKIGKAKGM